MLSAGQSRVDKFYKDNGPCCAGCDNWKWHNSLVGDCMKSAPVSAEERHNMLGIESCSLQLSAGHILTKRDHFCGEFIDTHEWSKINLKG